MKLCYQVATPDVAVAPSVTAFQGTLDSSFSTLSKYGYDGVELMTLDPDQLDWQEIKDKAEQYNLDVALVCTGEIFGQLGLSFADKSPKIRQEAVAQVKKIIDFASFLEANINIGRVRGQYSDDLPKETSYAYAIDAFKEISGYGQEKNVLIALESVTLIQTNFVNTVEEAAKVVDDVNLPNFKLMMDIFHLNIEEKDLFETINKYSCYNMHVHLADNNRRYPGNCGLDFNKIIKAFYDVGYDGAFCTEIYQLPDQETAAKGSIEHLTPIFKEIYGRNK